MMTYRIVGIISDIISHILSFQISIIVTPIVTTQTIARRVALLIIGYCVYCHTPESVSAVSSWSNYLVTRFCSV